MRLLNEEVDIIKKTFKTMFDNGSIYLFGSRVDDTKNGGDIDLFLDIKDNIDKEEILERKINFLIALKDKIGDQKIDVVVSTGKNNPIEIEVLKKGVKLS